MLAHDAIRAPGRQCVVESFVCRAYGLLVLERHSRGVEAFQIANAIIRSSRHHPGVTAFTQDVCEPAIVLEQKGRLGRQRSAQLVPVDGIREINIEICDDWPSSQGHVSPRRKVCLLYVLQLADESLLRRTTGTGIPFDRSLVDHDRKRKARVTFRLCHHQFRRLVNAVVRAVPVHNHAINSAADHVRDLTMDLFCIRGTVTDVHVVRASEPEH